VHYPVVVASSGDQHGVVYAGVRLAGTRAGHYDPAMSIIHQPRRVQSEPAELVAGRGSCAAGIGVTTRLGFCMGGPQTIGAA